PFAQFAFGMIQFRLAEALTVLAAMTPAAIPGLFLGCLLANTLNPMSLGPVDIILGSLATLISAVVTWKLSRVLEKNAALNAARQLLVIFPGVLFNALIVGTYLPFLLSEGEPVTSAMVASFIGWIFLSQTVVIYLIGWPLWTGLRKTKIVRIP
ncbi:MAG: QueT transporter family protein, partial [Clostridia bacterium]|nr:QueT transporter family protein [Clostridia bacterium]